MSEFKYILWDTSNPRIPVMCERSNWKTCPQHKYLSDKQPSFEAPNIIDDEMISSVDYAKPLVSNINDLSDQQRINLKRQGYVDFGDIAYRVKEDGESLEDFKIYESLYDLPDEAREKLEEDYFIVFDGVGYTLDEYGEIEVSFPDPRGAEYMQLDEWKLENGLTVEAYANSLSGETLDPEVESMFQNGGCAVYALALKEIHPDYGIAVDVWDCDNEKMYNHVFCVDPKTNKAYDSRGEFANPEALLDYASDKGYDGVIHSENEYYTDDGYQYWDIEQTKFRIKSGEFTYDDNRKDLEIIKKIIINSKPRISQ